MSYLGRFGVRRLAVIGAAVALGSGVGSVGLLSAAAPPAYAMSTGTCSESGSTTVTVTCTKGSGTWTPPAGLTSVAVDVEGAGGTQGLSGGSAGTGEQHHHPGSVLDQYLHGPRREPGRGGRRRVQWL